MIEDLRAILQASHKQLSRWTSNTPLERARPLGLKRNAIIIIGNLKIAELKEDLYQLADDPRLKDIADWALTRLT